MSNLDPITSTTEKIVQCAAEYFRAGGAELGYDSSGALCGLAYWASETRRWYAVNVDACRALLTYSDYSEWAADPTCAPAGEGKDSEEALGAAGWCARTEATIFALLTCSAR